MDNGFELSVDAVAGTDLPRFNGTSRLMSLATGVFEGNPRGQIIELTNDVRNQLFTLEGK